MYKVLLVSVCLLATGSNAFADCYGVEKSGRVVVEGYGNFSNSIIRTLTVVDIQGDVLRLRNKLGMVRSYNCSDWKIYKTGDLQETTSPNEDVSTGETITAS